MTPSTPLLRSLFGRFAVLMSALLFAGIAFAGTGPAVFINEIHYDNTGTDAGEFIEIAGPAGTNLTGYAIQLYNGAGGALYDTDPLSGTIPNQQNGFGTVFIAYPANGVQNGSPDGVALVNGTTVIQFLSYEGTFSATSGTALGMSSTDIGVSEAGTEVLGLSLQLQGSGSTYDDFTWTAPAAHTQGLINTGQSFGGGASLSINDVQVDEGNAGNTTATFTVTRSGSLDSNVVFNIATRDGSASTSEGDYVASSQTSASIPANQTTYSFEVTVLGDTIVEGDENFFVDLTSITGATAGDTSGTGTIRNDDVPPVAENIIINELDSDTPGADVAEFIELYDGGVGNTPLEGLVVVLYNGSNDLSYGAFDLDGRFTNSSGYFVLGNAGVSGVDIVFAGNVLQNGPDAVALYAGNASAFPNGTAISTTNLIDAVVYDTDDADDAGLLALLNPGEPQVNENGGNDGATHSIQRCPNGSGGKRDTSAYRADTPTSGQSNLCPPPPPEPVARTIHEIQGDGNESPFDGTAVITSGVVTLLKTNGFFLQTPDLDVDTNPATSEGIFVFTSTAPTVQVGDYATVTGDVDEFFTLTQVRLRSNGITVTSTGNELPAFLTFTTTLPSAGGPPDQLEKYEGMRVHADTVVSVAPTDFGETPVVVQGVPRPFREPGIDLLDPLPPGAPCCIPRFDQNPEKFVVDSDGRLGAVAINVNAGAILTGVTGPLDFAFGNYTIVTETAPGFSGTASATPVPFAALNEFTIASFNIENFFITSANFATKLSKASLAVRNVANSPDIIGVEEVGDIETLTALATRINADSIAAGQISPGYQAYLLEGDDRFSDDIDVGFLIRSRVEVVSITQEGKGETFVDPTDGSTDVLFERPPLVLRANITRLNATAFPVTVVVNHPQSLIDVEDPIRGPRQREKRRLQAEFTANLAQRLQSANLVMVGDFNSYQFNDGFVDVIGTIIGSPAPADQVLLSSPDLVSPNLTNLVEMLPADQRYSFIFEGNAQVLDHILVDGDMLGRFRRIAYGRVDADFSEVLFSSDPTRPERVSDHDIPVSYFVFPDLSADLSVTKTGPESVSSSSNLEFTIKVLNTGVDGARDVVVSDTVPPNTTFRSMTAPSGWTCTTPASGGTGTVSCTNPLLAVNSTATLVLTVNVNCATANGTIVNNTASVTAGTADPNSANNSATASVAVTNAAPVIGTVTVDKPVIGPPNHKMVDVAVGYTVTDNCGTVTTTLTVSSNQPQNGTGDGDTDVDWEVVNAHHVRLRAERSLGQERIYTITITATDSAGNVTTATTTVTVPGNNP